MKPYAAGMMWGEGPRWHRNALWLSDTQRSALWTDHDGTWKATDLDSPANGLWFLPDGRLTAAMMHEKRIGVWTGERFDTYADLSALATGPLGDLVGDRQGNLYVDDVGFAAHAGEPPRPGRVLRVAGDGSARVVAQDIAFPNGLAFIDDERTLIVVETAAQRLTAFTVEPDGTLADRRLYADIAELVGPDARPDGIWATTEGVWVATTTGHALVLVLDGELITAIDTGPAYPIACCGDGRGSLFVTLAETGGRPLFEALAAKAVQTTVAVVTTGEPMWIPSPAAIERARITDFARYASERTGRDVRGGYQRLWEWSVQDVDGFWSAVWDYFGLPSRPEGQPALASEAMPGSVWFPGSTLNYTTEVFRDRTDTDIAVVALTEDGASVEVSWGELRNQVASVAQTLSDLGVRPGDRVVGYLPNTAEAVVAFLATASLGAIWAVCGMDYVGAAAQARFAQLEPTVLITATRTVHGGRIVDRAADVAALRAALPTLAATVVIDDAAPVPDAITWSSATSRDATWEPLPVSFDHPLWVLFSSGTTGRPKGLVHGHGGVVLEQMKQSALHLDLRAGDRFLWYTTPSWMMWNSLVGALLVGATAVCYEGSPAYPGPDALWRLASQARVTVLGTSPGYLASCRRADVRLREHDLEALTRLGVTGSPLPADLQRWVAAELGQRVQVGSSSGGTDVVTAFVGPAPTVPVWAGELSAPCLGVALDAAGPDGRSVRDTVGELVVRRPMPSMPVRMWDDPDGARYRAAYFGVFPGVWRHGDWITVTDRGSVIIHGRSDSTLNRHGVRMGSADICGPVEELDEIQEALVVGVEQDDGDYWMPLFVTMADGARLDQALRQRITEAIRAHASPRHVPDEIIAAPGIPHTRTGKKLEVPIKRVLRGEDPATVIDPGSIDRPDLIGWYREAGAAHRGG